MTTIETTPITAEQATDLKELIERAVALMDEGAKFEQELEIKKLKTYNIDVANIVIEGNLPLLRYVCNKYPDSVLNYHNAVNLTSLIDLAAKHKHLHIITYLHKEMKITEMIYATQWAAEYGDLEILRYLYEEMGRDKLDKDIVGGMYDDVFHAIMENHPRIIQYLHEDMGYVITYDNIILAIKKKHLKLAKYLIESYEGQAIGH